jgi:hypothetical protein
MNRITSTWNGERITIKYSDDWCKMSAVDKADHIHELVNKLTEQYEFYIKQLKDVA